MKNWLKDKVVLITGASSGIGKEIAKLLILNYNCTILGVARNEDKLKSFKDSLEDKKDKFLYTTADVSKEEDWNKIYDFAKDKNCTVLINNAGTMLPFSSADKVTNEQAKKLFDTNFFSVIYGYKTFCNDFRKNKDCAIINISSVSAVASLPGTGYYSASKSALTAFSKITASEERKNFFIATYLPGTTQTNLFSSKDNSKPVVDEKAEKLLNKISSTSEKMSKKIVKAMAKKKKYKVFGFDAKLLKFFNKLMPIKSSDIYLKVYKKSKLSCFEDVFTDNLENKGK